jgi:glycosyltransferase involved in cell wall biosynthesis
MSRDELIKEYLAADVLFLHLNDYEAFKKVLPSKIFEYAATGKPVWAGVAGYAAEFIRSEVDNAAVFPPCDAEAAVDAFETLTLQSSRRVAFIQKFSRKKIIRLLAADIVRFLPIVHGRTK